MYGWRLNRMLLGVARRITIGAVLAALSVIMVLVATYTPIGKRLLFLLSGMPVLVAARIIGKQGSFMVYIVTGLLLEILIQPLRGIGYFLVTGGVALWLAVVSRRPIFAGLVTFALSLAYLSIITQVMGFPLAQAARAVSGVNPWLGSWQFGLAVLFGLSFFYPLCLGLLQQAIERHWLFREIFK